jgi:hypothetical protein
LILALDITGGTLHSSKFSTEWPNALRWFLCQELVHFTPWHFFTEPDEFGFAAQAFAREDVGRGQVFVFARRQDCDDFAGLEIHDGKIMNRVIYFHPVFGVSQNESPRTWNIVCETFDDVFEFVSRRVITDMKEWASDEDAQDFNGGAP